MLKADITLEDSVLRFPGSPLSPADEDMDKIFGTREIHRQLDWLWKDCWRLKNRKNAACVSATVTMQSQLQNEANKSCIFNI